MITSEDTSLIDVALAAAQAEMSNPVFDKENPHFRSKFASLAAVRNAVIPVLAKHGIACTQDLIADERGIGCVTILRHKGQWLMYGPLPMPIGKGDAQAYASGGTYAKRIHMQAVACVVGDEDDDGNEASKATMKGKGKAPIHSPMGDLGKDVPVEEAIAFADLVRELKSPDEAYRLWESAQGTDVYFAAWRQLKSNERATFKELVDAGKPKEIA